GTGDAGGSAGGGAAAAQRGADGGAAAPALEAAGPVRPRAVPAPAGPVDVPTERPSGEAPRFGLARVAGLAVPDDLAGAFGDRASGLYLARVGLGVSRATGGAAADYRSHDLALSRRTLSLATDAHANVWLVTEDGGAIRYDGHRFDRVPL